MMRFLHVAGNRFWPMVEVSWLVFLCYGPVGFFVMTWFGYGLVAINIYAVAVVVIPAILNSLGAVITAFIYLFRAPRKIALPVILTAMNYALLFSPLQQKLEIGGFAAYISPEPKFIRDHCGPISFVQDGKTYALGVCDLSPDDDFTWIYDTSGDIANYDRLSPGNRKLFAMTLRKYFNNDPNDPFEGADFTADRYYGDFYEIIFDDADAEGFSRDYGLPKNVKALSY